MRVRQKIVVALLLHARGEPTRTQLMKWLFLLRQETSLRDDSAFYDFVPYHYGPFSFEAYRDMDSLAQCSLIEPHRLSVPAQMRVQAMELEASLAPTVREAIREILGRYGDLRTGLLLDLVYRRYPWYASLSSRPVPDRHPLPDVSPAVYTIGYQGKSVDRFLNQLLLSGIKTLVDVRSNPASRKYGFSASSLGRFLTNVGVHYVQFPSLGIDGVFRKSVGSSLALTHLLEYYESTVLPQQHEALRQVSHLLQGAPCALMCFEADVQCCHRGRLAKNLADLTNLPLVHL